MSSLTQERVLSLTRHLMTGGALGGLVAWLAQHAGCGGGSCGPSPDLVPTEGFEPPHRSRSRGLSTLRLPFRQAGDQAGSPFSHIHSPGGKHHVHPSP